MSRRESRLERQYRVRQNIAAADPSFMEVPMSREQRWFAGVDWGASEHAVCIIDADGKVLGERTFEHSGSGVAEICHWLRQKSGADASNVTVATELPHGAVVETLLEQGFVVYAINPKQVDRFRDRFTMPGAKDDRRDAQVLADSIRTDEHRFRRLRVDDAVTIELREWSRLTQELQEERVRLANRVYSQLLRYFTQMFAVETDFGSEGFLVLWELIPSPEMARHVTESDVAKVLRDQGIRRLDPKAVLEKLRQPALYVTPGTTAAACAHIRSLAARLRTVNIELRQAKRRLDELTQAHGAKEVEPGQAIEQRDADILRSLPGVGRIVLATLLAEAPQLWAERDYQVLRALTGVAPVTRRSGKHQTVGMRYACHARLRNAVYHWSRVAAQCDKHSKAVYAALRARGHSHGRALRSLADSLLRLACAMLRSRTLYDPERRPVAA